MFLTTACRSNNSICHLVLSTSSSFLGFWLSEGCRDSFLSQVDEDDLPNLRLVCHDFAARTAPVLFEDVSITFRPSTFTKPARMAALERIGKHVRTLSISLPHGSDTFLPPLIDIETGEQRSFVYEPQLQKPDGVAGRDKQPKYGSWEMTDLLIKEYPPLFHAATNIPSFIRAFESVPLLTHLKISCPGQEASQRFRRSTVDYALISLRIAIERAPLTELVALSLMPIHPSGLFYLQPNFAFGATPSSSKRWSQIRKLFLNMDSYPYEGQSRTEHLRVLHSYIRGFSSALNRLTLRWVGERGPSPLSLASEPCLTSHHPGSFEPSLKPLKFPRLRFVEIENAITDAEQISTFVMAHRRTILEFNFEDVTLRSGTWDDALAPLTRITGNETWKQNAAEVMDVPLMLSPVDAGSTTPYPMVQEQHYYNPVRSPPILGRWLSKSKPSVTKPKTKEQHGLDHVKRLLKGFF